MRILLCDIGNYFLKYLIISEQPHLKDKEEMGWANISLKN